MSQAPSTVECKEQDPPQDICATDFSYDKIGVEEVLEHRCSQQSQEQLSLDGGSFSSS
jgi:hypothetical protein